MDKYTVGIVLMFTAVFISIGLMGRAKTKLEREELMIVSQLNSMNIKYLFAIILAIILLSSIGAKFTWIDPGISFSALIFILFAYVILSFFFSLRKLKENNFPKSYLDIYSLCALLKVVGVILLFIFGIMR